MSQELDSKTNTEQMSQDRTVVEVDELKKEFGDVRAVEGASFDVRNGEFFSIIGPSGSGKTTLLRMLAGFESPTRGTVHIEDRDCTYDKPYHRSTNMIFQDLALFPHLNVAENVGYGLVEAGVDESEREERISEVLGIVDLEGYQSRKITELSGGEQQRVALARGLVNEPSVLLLDEPLASLDERLKELMKVELKRIQDRTDTTFIYVTHDQEVALAMSDRIAILNEGIIQQIAPPNELYARPANSFVADFTGAENIFDVTERDRNGVSAVVELGDHTFTALLSEQSRENPDAPLRLVIRPEDISVTDGPGNVQGTVTDIVYKGGLMDVIADVDLGSEVITIQAEVHTETVSEIEKNDTVGLDWDQDKGLVVVEP